MCATFCQRLVWLRKVTILIRKLLILIVTSPRENGSLYTVLFLARVLISVRKKTSPRRRVDFTCLNLQVGNSWHIFVKQQSSDKLILHLIYRKKCSQVSAPKLRLHLFANLEQQQDLIVILIFLPKKIHIPAWVWSLLNATEPFISICHEIFVELTYRRAQPFLLLINSRLIYR